MKSGRCNALLLRTKSCISGELCEFPVAIICTTNQSNTRLRFATRFDSGDLTIKRSIVTFATHKLLCRPSEAGGPNGELKLSKEESLACLAVRLGLDFRATTWLDRAAERAQVERHMRICLFATEGFRSMVTISPSEPLIAEASCTVMNESLGPTEAPQALLEHINSSYLNPGLRGEVVAALLLLLARDKAVQNRSACAPPLAPSLEDDFKHDGDSRIVTVLDFVEALVPPASGPFVRGRQPSCCSENHQPSTDLGNAFDNTYIYFNHFIRVHDVKTIDRRYLCHLICRGAAVICVSNQRGVDILIPTLVGTILRPESVGAILIQVKNDPRFTNNVSRSSASLFTMMDPFIVGLFSRRDAPVPVLRIVLALAAMKSSVTGPKIPTRHSPHLNPDKFTAYDLWIAGVSDQSFGVIPNNRATQYQYLLDRTRDVFNGYGALAKDGGNLRKLEKGHIDLRRMMHPAVASNDQHFRNYICNLAATSMMDPNMVDGHNPEDCSDEDRSDEDVSDKDISDEDVSDED